MTDLKPILQSRSVWSSFVGILCLIASVFGVETRLIDQGALAEALLQVATGISFVGAIIFRVTATSQLTPK
jgi:choline-glycine betaine transporter